MIQIVDGIGVGAGKSYFVCKRMLATVGDGGTVFYADTFGVNRPAFADLVAKRFGVVMEEDQLRELNEKDMARLHEVTQAGTEDNPVLIVVDEAQGVLNARDWSDKSKRPLFDWLCQSRHDDNDLIFISQSAQNIDKQIRRLVTEVIRCRNLAKSRVPLLGGWPVFIEKVLDQDCTTQIDSRWAWHDKAIFGIYFSKSQRGKHARLAGVIPRKKLAKATTKKDMRIIIAIVLIAGGILAWALFTGKKPKAMELPPEKEEKAQSTPVLGKYAPGSQKPAAGQPAAAQGTPGPLQIVVEEFRGFISEPANKFVELHTDGGWYQLGQVSRHGLVDGVSDRAARIVRPDGGRTFIVAEQRAAGRAASQPATTPEATPTPPPAIPQPPTPAREKGYSQDTRTSGPVATPRALRTPSPLERRQADKGVPFRVNLEPRQAPASPGHN